MKLLGTIVNIHQKKVVQNQILEEIISVKPFFIGNNQMLNLADCNFTNHVGIITDSFCDKNINQFPFVQNF